MLLRAWWLLGALWIVGPSSQAVEPTARCSLAFQEGQDNTLSYRCRAWEDELVRRARADATLRARLNQLLPVQVPMDLRLAMTLRAGERTLAAGTHRLALAMDDGGAWQLRVLVEGRWQALPWTLTDGGAEAPYLSFALTPAADGVLALVMRWGPEAGRLVLREGPKEGD